MIKLFVCGISGRLGASIVDEVKKSSNISLAGGLVSGRDNSSNIKLKLTGLSNHF